MSESFAILRQRRSDELAKLADEHMQHDLQSGDRDKLKAAASSISLWTTVGSAVGVSLGLLAAIRLRSTRKAFFSAIRAQERPTKVIFEDGRTGMLFLLQSWRFLKRGEKRMVWLIVCLESIPDLTPLLKPTTLGDIATYFFATAGGLFLGGELGNIIFGVVIVYWRHCANFALCRLCWWYGERDEEYLRGPGEQEENRNCV